MKTALENRAAWPLWTYYAIMIVVAAADQLSKLLIKQKLFLNDTIPLIDGIFHITHVQNFGAAFSILQHQRMFFIVCVTIISAVMFGFVTVKHKVYHKTLMVALSMITGGGIGNLIDRVCQGYVTDFIDVRAINFAVFNVADMGVVCGAALMCWYLIFIEPKEHGNGTHCDNRK